MGDESIDNRYSLPFYVISRSSANESEDEGKNNNNSRCFTLRSTKKRPQPERNESTQQLDTADSLSSDEDDNFQLLTAENLFSTLLSRVRENGVVIFYSGVRRKAANFDR